MTDRDRPSPGDHPNPPPPDRDETPTRSRTSGLGHAPRIIRLRGPGDIVATLPFHLGYHPEDSLVVLCLDGGRVGCVGRADLPAPHTDPWPSVAELLSVMVRERPEAAVIVGVESVAGRSETVSELVRDVLVDARIHVLYRLVVRDGRYRVVECSDGSCPLGEVPVPALADVPAAADFVMLGRSPLASRSALGEVLRPELDHSPEAVRAIRRLGQAHARASRRPGPARDRRRAAALTAWADLLCAVDGERGPGVDCDPRLDPRHDPYSPDLLVSSLRDIDLRDLLIAVMCPGSLPLELTDDDLAAVADRTLARSGWWPRGQATSQAWSPARTGAQARSEAESYADGTGEWADAGVIAVPAEGCRQNALVDSLIRLCRRTPAPSSAPALTLLGHVAWWHGDGALARAAVERALAVEPDYRLAILLERMVDLSIRPGRAA